MGLKTINSAAGGLYDSACITTCAITMSHCQLLHKRLADNFWRESVAMKLSTFATLYDTARFILVPNFHPHHNMCDQLFYSFWGFSH